MESSKLIRPFLSTGSWDFMYSPGCYLVNQDYKLNEKPHTAAILLDEKGYLLHPFRFTVFSVLFPAHFFWPTMHTQWIRLLTLMVLIAGCSPAAFKQGWTRHKAPERFVARFETTRGDFTIEAYRSWSPAGVDRLYQLIRHGYFSNLPVYRVVPGFVAQFGALDTLINRPWEKVTVPDEPVITTNTRGTLAFARAGKNTRGTQFYINLADNARLDTSGQARGIPGFPVLGRVTSGMDVVLQFFPCQDEPRRTLPKGMNAIAFFKEKFPDMDYIKKAVLVKGRKEKTAP